MDPVLVQQFFNALALGAIYALIALGYTMVYGIIELINFAHGDVFMLSTFVSMWLLSGPLQQNGAVNDPLMLGVLMLLSFAVTAVTLGFVGVLIERFAYRPLRHAPRLAPLLTAIGVSFMLQNFISILFGPSPQRTPELVDPSLRVNIFGASVWYLDIFIFVLTVVLIVALQVFIGRTRLGRAMRSTAQDQSAAQLMGVDINRTIALTFFIGSALAGVAGVVYGLRYGQIQFTLGYNTGLKAFTAAVLGGIGNTTGAALGGFIIAFIEVGAAQLQVSRWADAIVFAVLIIVLVFRPSGLLGQATTERA